MLESLFLLRGLDAAISPAAITPAAAAEAIAFDAAAWDAENGADLLSNGNGDAIPDRGDFTPPPPLQSLTGDFIRLPDGDRSSSTLLGDKGDMAGLNGYSESVGE